MAPEATSSAIAVMSTAFALSLAALFYLFQKHIAGHTLLAYEPRRRVPWGPGVVVLAMGMPLLGILAFFLGATDPPADPLLASPTPEKIPVETLLITGWGNFAFMVMFVVGVAAWLNSVFRADAHDLGWPTDRQQLFKDIGLGVVATLAAFLPIYVVQLTLIFSLDSNTPHPLVQQLTENYSPSMLLLGFAMAVIAAPLFEEFTFRCLLQGWLERCEDETLAFGSTERHPSTHADEANSEEPSINETPSLRLDPEPLLDEPTAVTRPTRGWFPPLPHGWTPILLSGFAFGLAHLGHGVAPVSLVLFGIVLGYLYQRTHRLVPSITAHMLFNAYSMLLLWLQLETPPAG